MSLRTELVALAHGQGVSLSELARRFGIRRKTGLRPPSPLHSRFTATRHRTEGLKQVSR
jgi:hypothetical protein